MAGAITVKRTWRAEGGEIKQGLNPGNTQKILEALRQNWIITFPQGSTKPFAPGRKGTAYIIKQTQPIVIPVMIRGYWRAFNKKGLQFKKKGTSLSVTFKDPHIINYKHPLEDILEQIMVSIEQSKDHMLKGKHHQLSKDDK